MVERNTTVEHEFICLSDREIELDFEYLLMFDEINRLLNNYGYDISFFQDAKILNSDIFTNCYTLG